MAERTPVEEPGLLFVKKAEWTSWSSRRMKTVVDIHDFRKKIDDNEIKGKEIQTPMFKLGGVEMAIKVVPDYDSSGYIAVFLYNLSDQDQLISATVEAKYGKGYSEKSWERDEIRVNKSWGWRKFLSHKAYKAVVKEEEGYIFKLEATVILHIKKKISTDCSSW